MISHVAATMRTTEWTIVITVDKSSRWNFILRHCPSIFLRVSARILCRRVMCIFFRGGLNLNQELKRTIIADSFLEFEVLIEDRGEPRSIFVVTL